MEMLFSFHSNKISFNQNQHVISIDLQKASYVFVFAEQKHQTRLKYFHFSTSFFLVHSSIICAPLTVIFQL